MAYQDQSARPQREMFDISDLEIVCAECGTNVDKLPFRPTEREDGGYGRLYCYECNKKRMKNRDARRGFERRNNY